jgi:hypothetical protein
MHREENIGADSFADIQIHPPSSPLGKGGYEGGKAKASEVGTTENER